MYRMIYLADDDCDDQELFQEALNSIDANALLRCFDNGLDLIEGLLSDIDPLPEIIFLDLNMPLISGAECVNRLRRHNALRHLPIIAFSTSGNRGTLEDLYNAGANRYIIKPPSYSQLKVLIHNVLLIDWENDFFVTKNEFLVPY